jgi:hypothetical protein
MNIFHISTLPRRRHSRGVDKMGNFYLAKGPWGADGFEYEVILSTSNAAHGYRVRGETLMTAVSGKASVLTTTLKGATSVYVQCAHGVQEFCMSKNGILYTGPSVGSPCVGFLVADEAIIF